MIPFGRSGRKRWLTGFAELRSCGERLRRRPRDHLREVVRVGGFKGNGKIFAMHVKGGFVAKLPRDRVDELVRLDNATYVDPGHGRLMKEWVKLTGSERSWVALAREARRFVGGASKRR